MRPRAHVGGLVLHPTDVLEVGVAADLLEPVGRAGADGVRRAPDADPRFADRPSAVWLEYRWYVQTLYTSRKCKQVCIDRVPNRGAISDPNGRTPPTPTVSPTETP